MAAHSSQYKYVITFQPGILIEGRLNRNREIEILNRKALCLMINSYPEKGAKLHSDIAMDWKSA